MTTPAVSPPPEPPPPSQNIGPFYRVVGMMLGAFITSAFAGIILWRNIPATPWVVVVALLPFGMGVFTSLRPKWQDAIVRRIATKLPFTKYGDPDADR